jgi:aspartyl aminopeptidase
VTGSGFAVVGAHTDSPDLRVKPVSAQSHEGYLELGVMTYGGGLWTSWFDRDLTVAGRVLVRRGDAVEGRLVHVTDRAICRIPNIAIHLDRTQNEKFTVEKESRLLPVLAAGLDCDHELTGMRLAKGSIGAEDNATGPVPVGRKHHPALVELLASELGCEPGEIEDLELSVVDHAPCAIGGIRNDFVFAPRLDNLCMSFCGIEALIASKASAEASSTVRLLALFDHEEVGSSSTQGAASTLMLDTMRRVTSALPGTPSPDAFERAIRSSFLISADMAHAVHPALSSKHEENHRPRMHGGPVVKINANQRYATNGPSSAVLRELSRRHSIPLQEFVVRNDSPCGSTIGPILASGAGLRTVDIGNPMLSMHSIREMCGTQDVQHAVDLMREFYNEFEEIDASIKVEAE